MSSSSNLLSGEHDPEGLASRYLVGELSAVDREEFSQHLLSCEECWSEVSLARAGRALAESLRLNAPQQLRERLRTMIAAAADEALVEVEPGATGEAAPVQPALAPDLTLVPALAPAKPHFPVELPQQRSRRISLAVAAGVVLLASSASLALPRHAGHQPAQPQALSLILSDYSQQKLPGTQLARRAAPDLTALSLKSRGTASGWESGMRVDAFAYQDPAGRRVVVYLSDHPFPAAQGPKAKLGPEGSWSYTSAGTSVVCKKVPRPVMVVGQDADLVLKTAQQLDGP